MGRHGRLLYRQCGFSKILGWGKLGDFLVVVSKIIKCRGRLCARVPTEMHNISNGGNRRVN